MLVGDLGRDGRHRGRGSVGTFRGEGLGPDQSDRRLLRIERGGDVLGGSEDRRLHCHLAVGSEVEAVGDHRHVELGREASGDVAAQVGGRDQDEVGVVLAGEIGDGVLMNYLVSAQYNERAIARIEAGAQKAGRSLEDVDRPQLVVVSMDEDRAKALDVGPERRDHRPSPSSWSCQ